MMIHTKWYINDRWISSVNSQFGINLFLGVIIGFLSGFWATGFILWTLIIVFLFFTLLDCLLATFMWGAPLGRKPFP